MLAQSGFGWDWENNMVTVESDEAWARYVEVLKIILFFAYFCKFNVILFLVFCVG